MTQKVSFASEASIVYCQRKYIWILALKIKYVSWNILQFKWDIFDEFFNIVSL